MPIFSLALRSLWNRRYTGLLTLLSIALAVTLLLGVERLRSEARNSFANSLSGTDLVVGARSGQVPLLLYSVFRLGNASNNIDWDSYQAIAARKEVAWTVPLALGDSHRGYPVLGTTDAYLAHYQYADHRPLELAEGQWFSDLYDAVLGAQVARELGYGIGDRIVLAHGGGEVSFSKHDDKPMRVAGILAPTGTPVDRTVHVSLAAIEAMHLQYRPSAFLPGRPVSAEQARAMDLTPQSITAFLLGLHSRAAVFRVQRAVNEYPDEPLLAILPGAALSELWSLIGVGEKALLAVSSMVVLVGLAGMLTALLAGLNERRRELAILRSLGARPWQLSGLLVSEAATLTLLGIAAGIGMLYLLLAAARPLLESQYGLHLGLGLPSAHEWGLLGVVLAAGVLIGAIPAWRAYRYSLADGMSIRL